MSPIKISRTKAVEIINSTNGKFFTVAFVKKDGTTRIMNCNKKKNSKSALGYIVVNDISSGKTKNVDPRTILGLSFNKQVYKIK